MRMRTMQLYERQTDSALEAVGRWLNLRFWQAAARALYTLYRYKKAVRSLFWLGIALYLASAALTFLIAWLF